MHIIFNGQRVGVEKKDLEQGGGAFGSHGVIALAIDITEAILRVELGVNVGTAGVGVLVSILRIELLLVALLNVVVAEGGVQRRRPIEQRLVDVEKLLFDVLRFTICVNVVAEQEDRVKLLLPGDALKIIYD